MDEHTSRHRTANGIARPRWASCRRQRPQPLSAGPRPRLPLRRFLILPITATAIAASAALVAAQGGGSISPVFPDEPQADDGSGAFSLRPRPRECRPARDRPGELDYFPLANFRARPAANPYLKGAPVTRAVTFRNRKRQRFTVYISASNVQAVRRYIDDTSVCLEWLRRTGIAPGAVTSVEVARHFVAAATQATGLTEAQLSVRRDALAATGLDRFADVIANANGDLGAIIDAAAVAIDGELQQLVAAGELDAATVAAFDIRGRLAALATDPGAPFLADPADVPRSRAALVRALREDRRHVIVALRPHARRRPGMVVWFAADGEPTNARAAAGPYNITNTHGYIAECRRQAVAWIAVWGGKASVQLWRQHPFYVNVGTRTASGPDGKTTKLVHPANPANRKYYDVEVKNKKAGGVSRYSIYEAWDRGSGKRC
jgi:hypothetical protein